MKNIRKRLAVLLVLCLAASFAPGAAASSVESIAASIPNIIYSDNSENANIASTSYTDTNTGTDSYGGASDWEWEVLKLTNKARMQNGRLPLSTFSILQSAAGIRANELLSLFSHTRPDDTDCFTIFKEYGLSYSTCAENIAAGQSSPDSVLNSWLNSAGHYANIMNSALCHMGVGYDTGAGYGKYWVQLFLTDRCTLSSISLHGASDVMAQVGESIDDMGIIVELSCSEHGSCYLPLIEEMCSGYDQSATGNQTVTVNYGSLSVNFSVTRTPSVEEPDSLTGFADVAASDYFYAPVVWAVEQGVTTGTSATTFSPSDACTRGQIITFLWRAAGSPAPTGSGAFSDVDADEYYADATQWASEQGLDLSDGAFRPADPCTRATVAEYLYRLAGSPAVTAATDFTDVSTADGYADAVAWAVEQGVTTGTSATTFSPSDTCTRGQIVTFLYRALA